MEELDQPQTTLREVIEQNVEAAEAGTLPSVEEAAEQAQRARDEAGRFAKKPEDAPVAAPQGAQVAPTPAPQRPTTWKKEYLPMWDKLATGQPLSPEEARKLAEYSNQRENEYKTGVSTYKAEAMQAKELQEAITPFIPELQSAGINPSAWIKSMGQAHYALYKGTPELKLQVFQALARQFNVPLGMITQPQQGPQNHVITDLMGQIQRLQQQVTGVSTWRQQQEQGALMGEIQKVADDSAKFPHFEAVREQMAQLLETGLAQDLPSAYDKACWMVPEIREQMTHSQIENATKTQSVAKAKARAVSPRSATPSGQVATSGNKDRRAALEDAFDQVSAGRV